MKTFILVVALFLICAALAHIGLTDSVHRGYVVAAIACIVLHVLWPHPTATKQRPRRRATDWNRDTTTEERASLARHHERVWRDFR